MTIASRTAKPLWLQLRQQGLSVDHILDRFGVESPPVPIRAILRELGVRIHPVFGLERERGRLADGKLIAKDAPPSADIWLDISDRETRQRFTLAHELGHLMMHPLGVVYRGGGAGYSHREREANRFAADFLMPSWMIIPYARALDTDVSALADAFGVSHTAMGIRLGEVLGAV